MLQKTWLQNHRFKDKSPNHFGRGSMSGNSFSGSNAASDSFAGSATHGIIQSDTVSQGLFSSLEAADSVQQVTASHVNNLSSDQFEKLMYRLNNAR